MGMKGVRVLFAALGASATLGIVASGPAAAAGCRTVPCLRRQVNSLSKLVRTDTRAMTALRLCLYEVPVSLYGDSSGSGSFGYWYSSSSGASPVLAAALDATPSGDQVSAWMLTDGCNTATTATVRLPATRRSSRLTGLAPIAGVAPLMPTFPLPGP
jgi:hypothetical protein